MSHIRLSGLGAIIISANALTKMQARHSAVYLFKISRHEEGRDDSELSYFVSRHELKLSAEANKMPSRCVGSTAITGICDCVAGVRLLLSRCSVGLGHSALQI